jgi:hypothetical protein
MPHLIQYSFAGLHKKVLVAKDKAAEKDSSTLEDLTGFKETDAVNEILKRAKTHQIVMINEAHNMFATAGTIAMLYTWAAVAQ